MHHLFTVAIGNWQEFGKQASAIRHEVFVIEQQVPIELELDEYDTLALHALAFDGDTVIGTGRLLPDAHIGRLAVRQAYRGQGVGAMLLKALVEQAYSSGHDAVVLAAQCHAQGFYLAQGFVAEGDVFMDAGIEHIQMRKRKNPVNH